jgi:hypothetical protein
VRLRDVYDSEGTATDHLDRALDMYLDFAGTHGGLRPQAVIGPHGLGAACGIQPFT